MYKHKKMFIAYQRSNVVCRNDEMSEIPDEMMRKQRSWKRMMLLIDES